MFVQKITRRINKIIREKKVAPELRKRLKSHDWSLLCNNCTGGFIMHDLKQQFRTPTVNLFFPGMCFFDFCTYLSYYIEHEVIEVIENNVNYPVGKIQGNGVDIPDVTIHFMHYSNFELAKNVWNRRKKRINYDNVFVMWTFAFENYDEDLYRRFESLPQKNKVGFTNNRKMSEKYPSIFYISGFDDKPGVGLLSDYYGLFGKRYYDQFDYVRWFNEN